MTPETALEALTSHADASRAADLETRFGTGAYLGVSPDAMETLAREWRADAPFPERLDLARALWDAGPFEGRLMAAKLLTAARIKEDAAVWETLNAWLDAATTWAEVDALAAAGSRRVMADPSRIDAVETRAMQEAPLQRRAALGLTEALAKTEHPKPEEEAALDRACDWLPAFLEDDNKDVHRRAQTWLRSLSKHHFKRAKAIRTARN